MHQRGLRRRVGGGGAARLNVAFLALAAVLVWRFLRTGGLPMLRMMNQPAEAPVHHH